MRQHCTGFAATRAQTSMYIEQPSLIYPDHQLERMKCIQYSYRVQSIIQLNTQNWCVAASSERDWSFRYRLKIEWLWLIGWFRCPCSLFRSRFEYVFNGNENGENTSNVTRSPAQCINASLSIFYPRCRANFLSLPNLSFKASEPHDRPVASFLLQTLVWWLINFSMICMRCVCCHLQRS